MGFSYPYARLFTLQVSLLTKKLYTKLYFVVGQFGVNGGVMIIKAKRESKCLRCEETIRIGEKIEWEPGELRVSHVQCPERAIEKKKAGESLESISFLIRNTGEIPAGMNTPEGEKLIDKTNHYGGGFWYIVGVDGIWYVENNSHDGDNWDACNVKGVGPGGIGWRVPYTEELAQKIRHIARILNN